MTTIELNNNIPDIMVEEKLSSKQIIEEKHESSSSEGPDSDDLDSPKRTKLTLAPRHKRQDSGSSVGEEEVEVTEELRQRIVTQAEYYFSDENLKKDGFLLKHVKRNKEGYVNLKLLASFKKMRSLTRNYIVIGDSIKAHSKLLVINETGLKLRRVNPLPKELLEQVRVKHVVVSKIPNENPSMDYVTNAFVNNKNDVVSVRIIRPGKKFPNDLQSHFSKHAELRDETVAIVEFENPDTANEASKTNFSGEYTGLNACLLELGPKQGKKKGNGDTDDSDAGRNKNKKNNHLLDINGKDDGFSSYASSSDNEFAAFASCGKRYARSHGNSPASSPQSQRKFGSPQNSRKFDGSPQFQQKFDRNNNSNNNSPASSPGLSPKFNRRNNKTPDRSPMMQRQHKLSPLISGGGSPTSSPNVKRSEFGGKVADEGHSAWMMKRMENQQTCNRQLQVVRQPRGPDGSCGFSMHPITKYVMVHSH